MRLPLGILTGVGFVGGRTKLKRGLASRATTIVIYFNIGTIFYDCLNVYGTLPTIYLSRAARRDAPQKGRGAEDQGVWEI